MTDSVRKKLKLLGVFPDTEENPDSTRVSVEVFQKCSTVEEICRECGDRHWGCGGGQFVYFHLEGLLNYDPSFKERLLREAKEKLGNLGIKPEHIEEYILTGPDANLVFSMRHEDEYPWEVRHKFYEATDQFVLDNLKEWLGINRSS